MEKSNLSVKETKRNTERVKIIFSIIILSILFLAELYIMINNPTNYIVLMVITVLFLTMIYILVVSIMQENFHIEVCKNDQYENIFKSEKASYLLLRKNFENIQERLDDIENKSDIPTDEIIAAEKAIAKVSISRSKENTDALMNSNDKLLEKIFDFESILETNNEDILEKQNLIVEKSNTEIILKQQEMLAALKEMERSIKNELLQFQVDVPISKEPEILQVEEMAALNKEQQEEKSLEKKKKKNLEEEISLKEEPALGLEEEISLTEEPLGLEDVEDEVSLAEEPLGLEDEIGLAEEPLGLEDEIGLAEEPLGLEDNEIEEKIPPMPDLSDPNKVMSSEDIAALIANTSVAEKQAEALEEPKVVKPIKEEVKPPMPDLSDPNKTLSAEEIAALFANM